MEMVRTWYTDRDKKIDRIQETSGNKNPLPEDKNWKESLVKTIKKDDPLDLYEIEAGRILRRIPDDELVGRGIRTDKRGLWYNKETREQKRIYNLDEGIDENEWTLEAPLEKEEYQVFGLYPVRYTVLSGITIVILIRRNIVKY